jgi:hypothetical protein
MEGLKGKHFLDAFPSEICLKGVGPLPPFLFNFAQEYVLRGVEEKRRDWIRIHLLLMYNYWGRAKIKIAESLIDAVEKEV